MYEESIKGKKRKAGGTRYTTKAEELNHLRAEVVKILRESGISMTLAYLQYELSKRIKQKVDVKKYGYEKFSTFVGKHIHKL